MTHPHTQYQRTIHCRNKLCTPTTRDHNIHYVSYPTALAHRVQHCPSCHSVHIQTRDFSYVDWMCTSFSPMNAAIASALVEELSNQNADRWHKSPLQIEDIMAQLPNPPTSNGICPLHVTCTKCHGTFNIVRTKPSAHTPPVYCIWCGYQTIVTDQYSTLETSDYVLNTNSLSELAIQYDVSDTIMNALHDMWQSDSVEPLFSTYLQAKDAAMILALGKGRRNVQRPPTPQTLAIPQDKYSNLPIPAHLTVPQRAIPEEDNPCIYYTCKVCGCELPNRPGTRKPTFKVYCEPCDTYIQNTREQERMVIHNGK